MVSMVWTTVASAYPWMIRHGYGGCAGCHADPSGGELLTKYGRAQGDLILRMRYGNTELSASGSERGTRTSSSFDDFDDFDDAGGGKEAGNADVRQAKAGGAGADGKRQEVEDLDEPGSVSAAAGGAGGRSADETQEDEGPGAASGFLWGLIDTPDWLLLGGSFRYVNMLRGSDFRTFPMQADLYGQMAFGAIRLAGSIGVARVPVGSPHARAAQITTGQGEELNAISRTHWVGFDLGPEVLLRAGRLNVPFGVRLSEHVMWVREATKTDRESDQQHGAALAYSGSLFRGEAMLIAGNYQINPDRYRERGYGVYVETLVTEPFATGVSSLMTVAEADNITLEEQKTVRGAHGVFFRVKVSEPVVLMFEADALHKSRRELGYVGFLQLDYEPVQGLHFGGTGEVLDRGYRALPSATPGIDLERAAGLGKPRFGGWLTVDWFFLPSLEMRIDAIFRQQDPFTVMGQLHAYL